MKKVPSASKKKQKGVTVRRINPNAAGIDLGSRFHYVALPPDRTDETVRRFGCYTEDLLSMAQWLIAHGITTAAMEATGVYWIPVYQVLERAGLQIVLINAKHYKNVPGRKTDVQDCQWLQHLHECGLLTGSFRPEDAICVVRSYVRHRETLVEDAGRCIQRMQKALEQMNIQLHKAVANLQGTTGMAIVRDIVAGIRDAKKLAQHRNYRCHKDPEEFVKALRGDWREEHLFSLRHQLELYDTLQIKIDESEVAMRRCWEELGTKPTTAVLPPPKSKKLNVPEREQLFKVARCDLTAIDGLGLTIVQTLIAEIGVDMSKWETEGRFASWAGVCPRNNITGGKRKRERKHPGCSRVATVFRMAAQTLSNSKTALGAYYRRMRSKRGPGHACGATAHKLARIFYRMMKFGQAYVAESLDRYNEIYKERAAKAAVHRLNELGYNAVLTPNPALNGTVS